MDLSNDGEKYSLLSSGFELFAFQNNVINLCVVALPKNGIMALHISSTILFKDGPAASSMNVHECLLHLSFQMLPVKDLIYSPSVSLGKEEINRFSPI